MNRDTDSPWALNVIVSPHMPKGEMILLGQFDKPPNWDALDPVEKMRIAARHSVKIIVGPDLAESLATQRGS